MSEAHATTDHETIRRWTEERRGHPATVATTVKNGEAGVLRIDFDPEDEGLEAISWDKFFARFDSARLAFLYQDRVGGSAVSRFHKFVDRSSVKTRN